MKLLLDCLIYVLVRVFLALIGIMPRLLAYPLCEALATLVFWADRKHRRIGMINLNIAFPEKDEHWKKRILRQSFQQIGDHVVELSRLPRLTRDEVACRVGYEEGRGLEHYLNARRQSQVVLFLTAHISAWELLPAAHALHGHPLNFVVRPLDNPFLERWAIRLRSRFGNRVIGKERSMRQILKILKEGGDVGFLLDQNVQEKGGVYVPLFGHPASTSSTLAALALRTSAPIVAGFIYPTSRRGHYVIRFYPPIQLRNSGNPQKDLIEGTALFNRYIEEVIREYPHCWLWGHRRFHTQPDGSDVYGATDHRQQTTDHRPQTS
ncbi:lysophospholipid acyltransferase family protein [Acidobacteria bacterium AH-259-O06]|nr:lysophospholipid acyltransferase family protein [Acidobacteria bacterium AH-259-O06]